MVRRVSDGTAISTLSFEPREGLAVCTKGKGSAFFPESAIIGLVLGIGLPTSRSAGQRAMADILELSHGKNIKIKFCLCLQGTKS